MTVTVELLGKLIKVNLSKTMTVLLAALLFNLILFCLVFMGITSILKWILIARGGEEATSDRYKSDQSSGPSHFLSKKFSILIWKYCFLLFLSPEFSLTWYFCSFFCFLFNLYLWLCDLPRNDYFFCQTKCTDWDAFILARGDEGQIRAQEVAILRSDLSMGKLTIIKWNQERELLLRSTVF